MGLLQPNGRRRGCDGQARLKTIVVANLREARAALDAARASRERITLASPPDAIIRYGVLHFVTLAERLAAEYPDLRPSVAVDCGDRADLAHDAMRLGLKSLIFRGDPAVAAKLAAIAREIGVHFEAPNAA
ncbi:MAG TPA: hypothetical protein VMT54_00485 [Candidatus Cybelea sp.]|nr:hypothetical protein [Candidatus Cybelea sp.]